MNPLDENNDFVLTDAELLSYLDETLAVERSTRLERLLRTRSDLRQRTALLARWRDQGGHSVGEIWRRRRLSCLSRSQLGSYVLNVSDPELVEYIEFHLNVIECRFCRANVEDLKGALSPEKPEHASRQKRYFESSAGLFHSRSGSK